MQTILPVQYIDFIVQPGKSFTHTIAAEMETVIVYIYTGAGEFTDRRVSASEGETLLLGVRWLPLLKSPAKTCSVVRMPKMALVAHAWSEF